MQLILILGLLAGALFAADPNDKQKLAVRTAEAQSHYAAAVALQAQLQAREATEQAKSAAARYQAALADLGKVLGCEINSETLDCKPPAPAKGGR